jgi:hypothetical protein
MSHARAQEQIKPSAHKIRIEVDLMKIEVTGYIELNASLVKHMDEMKIEPASFFKDRLDEVIEGLDKRITNELGILSPCLTSNLCCARAQDRY